MISEGNCSGLFIFCRAVDPFGWLTLMNASWYYFSPFLSWWMLNGCSRALLTLTRRKWEMMSEIHFWLSFHIKRNQLRRFPVWGLPETCNYEPPCGAGTASTLRLCLSGPSSEGKSRDSRLRWFGTWGEIVSTLLEGSWRWNCQAGEPEEDKRWDRRR